MVGFYIEIKEVFKYVGVSVLQCSDKNCNFIFDSKSNLDTCFCGYRLRDKKLFNKQVVNFEEHVNCKHLDILRIKDNVFLFSQFVKFRVDKMGGKVTINEKIIDTLALEFRAKHYKEIVQIENYLKKKINIDFGTVQ